MALYSEGVMSNSRIAVFLNAIVNRELRLSEGSIFGFCKKFAKRVVPEIARLEAGLLNQSAAATDPTVVTVNGKQNYIRNFSAEDTIVYEAMEKKSIPALKEVVFLKRYTGILVHDNARLRHDSRIRRPLRAREGAEAGSRTHCRRQN